jgi:excisionase family DNA binding protein
MSINSSPLFELLTIVEAAQLMKVSVTSVRRLQRARRLPFTKVGGSVRFFKEDILYYLTERRLDSIE